MANGDKWTREEILMAFVLYRMISPRDIKASNDDVKALAGLLGRTPKAVKAKLWNISAYDPERVSLGFKGMPNVSAFDRDIWAEFDGRGDQLITDGLILLNGAIRVAGNGKGDAEASLDEARPDAIFVKRLQENIPEGIDRMVIATERVNQNYFRNGLLESYGHSCCLTGLKGDSLLMASHIKPWAKSNPKTERTILSNGLLLNALHDRAFDQGLITLDKHYCVRVSRKVKHDSAADAMIWTYDGRKIEVPKQESLRPRADFIAYHNDMIFQG